MPDTPQGYLVTTTPSLQDLVNAINRSGATAAEVLRQLPKMVTQQSGDVTFDLQDGSTPIVVPTIAKLIAQMQTGGLDLLQRRVAKAENLLTGAIHTLTTLAQKLGQEVRSPYWSKFDLTSNADALDTDPLFRAKIDGGFARFPYEAYAELPLDRKLETFGTKVGGWLMPTFTVNNTAVKRYATTVVANVVNVNAYPGITKQVTRTGTAYYQYYYGYYYTWYYYYYNWSWGSYTYQYTQSVNESLTGSMVAQTFQLTQPYVALGFDIEVVNPGGTKTAAAPKLLLVETEQGQPVFTKVIARGSLDDNTNAANTSTTATTAVQFILERPVLLKPGVSYAIVLIASNTWNVAYSGNAETTGNLFYTQDGQYWLGDIAKDVCFAIRIADFGTGTTTWTVDLAPLQLSGGIASFFMRKAIEAAVGADVQIQADFANNGVYVPISDGANLQQLQPFCPLRAVFTGTQYAMPILNTQVSQITHFRPGTTMRIISKDRAVRSPNIDVRFAMWGYDASDPSTPMHSFDPKLKLVDGANPLTTISPTNLTVAGTGDKKYTEFTATFTIPAGVTKYRFWFTGTTLSAANLFDITGIIEY